MTEIFFQANFNNKHPSKVKALITSRCGGFSTAQYASLNLAMHVADDTIAVTKNRQLLQQHLPSAPFWLEQTHSNQCICLDQYNENGFTANGYDASFTTKANKVCAILTADCLPLLLTNTMGTFVAAIHAGWRGLLNGVIANTINSILLHDQTTRASDMLAFIAPSICPEHFIVQRDVVEQFVAINSTYRKYFTVTQGIDQRDAAKQNNNHIVSQNSYYQCDLRQIALAQLGNLNIKQNNITLSPHCTFNNDNFYSYRQSNITGRFASLIWLLP